jgi:hypothetical protein
LSGPYKAMQAQTQAGPCGPWTVAAEGGVPLSFWEFGGPSRMNRAQAQELADELNAAFEAGRREEAGDALCGSCGAYYPALDEHECFLVNDRQSGRLSASVGDADSLPGREG